MRPSPRVGPCSLAGGRTHDRGCGQETNDDLSLPGTDSQAASDLLRDKFPEQANGSVPIAFRAPAGAKLSDTRYKKPIEQVTSAYGKDSAVTHAVGPFSEQGADQLNKKRTIGYISLNLKDSPPSSAPRRHNGSSASTAH